jgi:hypothetical protein
MLQAAFSSKPMPHQLERINGQPILISTFNGVLKAEELRGWWAAVTDHSAAIGRGYHIVDVRDISLDLNSLMAVSRESWVQDAIVNFADLPLVPVVIGTDEMARIATSLGRTPQFSRLAVPIFRSRDEALAYIQNEGRV